MALKFTVGQAVKQVMPAALEGVIADAVVVDGELHYRVDWTGEDGHARSKFFGEDQIEAVVAAQSDN